MSIARVYLRNFGLFLLRLLLNNVDYESKHHLPGVEFQLASNVHKIKTTLLITYSQRE